MARWIVSMLFIAGSVLGTLRTGELWGYTNPWTVALASVGTGFYLGNIYGSYHSAIKNKWSQKEKTTKPCGRYYF